MVDRGFRYFKYFGRALSLSAGVFVGLHLRKNAFYSPMREELADIVEAHERQSELFRQREGPNGGQPVPARI